MILYIAEKPSLGRAIAAALPGPQTKAEGCIRLANGDVVSWCIGHLLEQAEPEDYDPAFKRWQFATLPIMPTQWQLKAKKTSSRQLTVLKQLIKQADEIVHAGDPDREGQLLVDEVLAFCKLSPTRTSQVKRLLISDLTPAAVKKSLQALRPNKEFVPLSTSALARSRADWLYGINMTRAYTIQGQKSGYNGVLSVGRVQTPLLGLIVRRDLTIENFVPVPHFGVSVDLVTDPDEPAAPTFSAKWQPSKACEPYQDEEGRVLVKALAEKVVKTVNQQWGEVTDYSQQQKQQPAPLPYQLSALQIDAAKRFGLSAQQVLDACQQLYEQHQLITYPRSDCCYLPEAQWAQAKAVINAIAKGGEQQQAWAQAANPQQKSKAWNDALVGAHHAIIPTDNVLNATRLSAVELKLYQLIVKRYLAQFYPAFEYAQTKVAITICGGLFTSQARQELSAGWKSLYRDDSKNNDAKRENPSHSDDPRRNDPQRNDQQSDTNRDDTEQQQAYLPKLKVGQAVFCQQAHLLEKITQPPEHYTDATLLAAMTGIARYVQDAELKKILKDTDGLGTEATRAGIIELLFKRGFIVRHGKQITATAAGRSLIAALPVIATAPDMTAHWESLLNAMKDRQCSYQQFMMPLQDKLQQLVIDAQSAQFASLGQQSNSAEKGATRGNASGFRKGASKRPYRAKSASTGTKSTNSAAGDTSISRTRPTSAKTPASSTTSTTTKTRRSRKPTASE
jgi:DNA topoisomerase-3